MSSHSIAASPAPSRAIRACHDSQLLEGERVVEALHPLQVVDGGELGRERAADLLGGAVRRLQLGELLLELVDPAPLHVVVGVGQRRLVEHEVAPARVLDLLCKSLMLVAVCVGGFRHGGHRVAHGHILPCGTDMASPEPALPSDRPPTTKDQRKAGGSWADPASRAPTRTVASARSSSCSTAARSARRSRSTTATSAGDAPAGSSGRSANAWRTTGSRSGCCATASAAGTTWPRRRRCPTRGGPSTRSGRTVDVPVVIVGHSMGARTGARVADDPSVRGLVALAPWFPPGEPVAALQGKDLVVAHGRRDRITSYDAPAPSSSSATASRGARRSPTWAPSATTCCAGSPPGTTWPPRARSGCSPPDRLVRTGVTSRAGRCLMRVRRILRKDLHETKPFRTVS